MIYISLLPFIFRCAAADKHQTGVLLGGHRQGKKAFIRFHLLPRVYETICDGL